MMYLSLRKLFLRCRLLTVCQDPEKFEQEYAAHAAPQAQVRPEVVRKPVGVEGEGDDDDDFTHVGKGGKATTYTSEGIYKHLQAIHEARGKKVRLESWSACHHIDVLRRRIRIVPIKFVYWRNFSMSPSHHTSGYVFCSP